MPPPTPQRTTVRSIAMLLAMLLLSGLFTALAAFLALEWMPCSWFGSSFEGACGYGAVWSVAGAALLLWPALFLGSAAVYFRRGRQAVDAPASAPSSAAWPMLRWWQGVLGLTLLVQVLPLLLLIAPVNVSPEAERVLWWLGLAMLVLNAVLVYSVASRLRRSPLLLALISLVFGWLGAAGVGIYLHGELRRPPSAG